MQTETTPQPDGMAWHNAWLSATAQGEPYRLLFPLGAMIGVYGVMLWPAFVLGWIPFYPGIMHARIMVQGFVFCFMAGFLGSALPHMLEVKGMPLAATVAIAMLILLVVALQSLHLTTAGDIAFLLTICTMIAWVMSRWSQRTDLPPPGMALAALGLLSGAAGSLIMPLALQGHLPAWMYVLGKNLLHQAMILLPVLGLGAYLLPRMAGLPNRHLFPKSRQPSKAWLARALFMLTCGMVLLASFGLETAGYFRAAYALRFAAATCCLLHETPLYRAQKLNGSIPRGLMISVLSIFSGYLVIAVWPEWQMTLLHIVFISGFGLLILNIAARVILGHSGHGALIYTRHRAMNWIIGLVILAMATRVSADLIPGMQLSHYAYASLTWAVITLVWLAMYGPFLMEKGGEG